MVRSRQVFPSCSALTSADDSTASQCSPCKHLWNVLLQTTSGSGSIPTSTQCSRQTPLLTTPAHYNRAKGFRLSTASRVVFGSINMLPTFALSALASGPSTTPRLTHARPLPPCARNGRALRRRGPRETAGFIYSTVTDLQLLILQFPLPPRFQASGSSGVADAKTNQRLRLCG
jgi:hypothetical protein